MKKSVKNLIVGSGLLAVLCLLPHSPWLRADDAIHSATRPATTRSIDPVVDRIRDEGLNHSHVDQTLDYLCNVIGQRLTASPSQARASEWTRDQMNQWGLADAHLEPWGPFGKGWQLQEYSLQMTEPYPLILHGYPKAWSPGFDQPITTDVVYLDAKSQADLAKYAGKLAGKVVLIGLVHPTDAHFDPQATRLTADELAKLKDTFMGGRPREMLQASTEPALATKPAATQAASSRPSVMVQNASFALVGEELALASREHAAAIIDCSSRGDGGTIFVAQASVPRAATRPSRRGAASAPASRPAVYEVNAPAIVPQITLATEDFNRLVSLIRHDQSVKVNLNLKVQFYPPAETHPANTVAEIPGSDLKDQLVLVGGHLDSWQSGTGATDNAVGAACAMEAIRIIKALDLHPRRTIRVVLWTGEEEGLLGSAAYVKDHFGSLPEETPTTGPATRPRYGAARNSLAHLVKKPDYDRLSVYFNLDNGTGKIRGIYAQGNPAAAAIFRDWLKPFADLDASTVTMSNTGSTDHISFDRIGLPGFQFIQDPIEYFPRTHHSNEDVFDRIQMADMKQASTIMAAFLWDAANMDQRFPRAGGK